VEKAIDFSVSLGRSTSGHFLGRRFHTPLQRAPQTALLLLERRLNLGVSATSDDVIAYRPGSILKRPLINS
jgi:hypothetical protein